MKHKKQLLNLVIVLLLGVTLILGLLTFLKIDNVTSSLEVIDRNLSSSLALIDPKEEEVIYMEEESVGEVTHMISVEGGDYTSSQGRPSMLTVKALPEFQQMDIYYRVTEGIISEKIIYPDAYPQTAELLNDLEGDPYYEIFLNDSVVAQEVIGLDSLSATLEINEEEYRIAYSSQFAYAFTDCWGADTNVVIKAGFINQEAVTDENLTTLIDDLEDYITDNIVLVCSP
ncbi:hypothetical protein KC717_04935 [Candidatus Dojkabacteria bacterium]|uniref:Uncharacterized protein n=1 Tax=Candidatus Dojkabacteria bacterium TaxID=2099670 RepID=A0A955RL52_9BACT|nr:hypothetical protein [Candidatus Dojkabacteria bacterium]